MDSGINLNYQLQQQQPNSGLSRFNSAPSSFLANLMDSGVDDRGGLVSSFMTSGVGDSSGSTVNCQEFEGKSGVGFGNSRHSCSGLPPHYPRTSSAMDSSYELFMDPNTPVKSVNPSLVRQTSSPAGFFSKLSAQNGFATTKEMGTFSGMNGGIHGEASPPTSRLKSQLSFSSRLPSTLNILPQISEIESNEITTSPTAAKLGNGNVDSPLYNTGFSYGSWNDPSQFTIMKTEEDYETKMFSGTQNGDRGNSGHMLSHHLSLPAKTSVEKYLQFQDTVPCKIRAKRGCATHPRSIAERVRRTRISERMRKLQELVPNMDKQTNTADMLDLAVDYIKDLQKQYKTLSHNRATCKCSNIQSAVLN